MRPLNDDLDKWLLDEKEDWIDANGYSFPSYEKQKAMKGTVFEGDSFSRNVLFPPRAPTNRWFRDWALRLLTFGFIAEMFAILFLLFTLVIRR